MAGVLYAIWRDRSIYEPEKLMGRLAVPRAA
jgi:hypothetical protein